MPFRPFIYRTFSFVFLTSPLLLESKFAFLGWDCCSLVFCNYTSTLKKSAALLLPFSLSTFLHGLCFPPAFPAQETTFVIYQVPTRYLYFTWRFGWVLMDLDSFTLEDTSWVWDALLDDLSWLSALDGISC